MSLITPKQVAQAIGVSESSLKRWCDRGLLGTVRTAGGHRRMELDTVVEFLRRTGHALVRPELLGLPSNTGHGLAVIDRAREPLRAALLASDEEQCRRIVLDLFVAGHSASDICDQVLAPAFHGIGDRWSCGEAEVYEERRACDLCLRILFELRSMIPPAGGDAPLAIGGTPECDPYVLPTTMIELALRESKWRAKSLGSRLPFATLARAIERDRPRIFWLSVSHLDDESTFLREYQGFQARLPADVAVAVGGRALVEGLRRQMTYAAYCDNLAHLQAFAKTLHPTVATTAAKSRKAARGHDSK